MDWNTNFKHVLILLLSIISNQCSNCQSQIIEEISSTLPSSFGWDIETYKDDILFVSNPSYENLEQNKGGKIECYKNVNGIWVYSSSLFPSNEIIEDLKGFGSKIFVHEDQLFIFDGYNTIEIYNISNDQIQFNSVIEIDTSFQYSGGIQVVAIDQEKIIFASPKLKNSSIYELNKTDNSSWALNKLDYLINENHIKVGHSLEYFNDKLLISEFRGIDSTNIINYYTHDGNHWVFEERMPVDSKNLIGVGLRLSEHINVGLVYDEPEMSILGFQFEDGQIEEQFSIFEDFELFTTLLATNYDIKLPQVSIVRNQFLYATGGSGGQVKKYLLDESDDLVLLKSFPENNSLPPYFDEYNHGYSMKVTDNYLICGALSHFDENNEIRPAVYIYEDKSITNIKESTSLTECSIEKYAEHVKINSNEKDLSVLVVSSTGQIAKHLQVKNPSIETISITNFPSGMYFINVHSETVNRSFKIFI